MTVTIRKYRVDPDTYSPRYNEEPILQKICGESADDVMSAVLIARNNNDLSKYTPIEIVNIED